MVLEDNYSVSLLFITKQVTISVDKTQKFKINIPTIKDFTEDSELNAIYHLWTGSVEDMQKFVKTVNSSYELFNVIVFQMGMYNKIRKLANSMRSTLEMIIPDVNIDMKLKQVSINDITMTEEIWDYILYIIKLSCGEKATKPLTFSSEEARKFYQAQKAAEAQVAKVKNKAVKKSSSRDDKLAKLLLYITYVFPSMTIDYLLNQTMAQIQWLQKYAAGAMSYEVSANALAAGNMKKGKKLDFFIKF